MGWVRRRRCTRRELRRSSVLRMICARLMRLRGFEGMSVAQQLRLLSARLGEAALLFRYRARATEDDFAEAAYRWPDRRGREFVVGHVHPQMEVVRSVAGAVGDV